MTANPKAKTIAIDPSLLNVRSARPAKPVHADITPELISDLVDNFYAAAPLCSPTRASCLTGRTIGVANNQETKRHQDWH